MFKHKYAVGDRVMVVPRSENINIRPGVYTILQVLPVAGFGCQYRAKHAGDAHERVLDENLLRSPSN